MLAPPTESDPQAVEFRREVIGWATDHARSLPWRLAPTPYSVLISEIMLRRTRAEQAARVFERFLILFPDAASLAQATEPSIAEIVRPLGLDWRVPAFRAAARAVMARGGDIPAEESELRLLPGVGDYVAAAVVSLAFDKPSALVDTNTVRVAGRYFGFPYHAESRRNSFVRSQVRRLFDPQTPRKSAIAILDFAAVICRARAPRCSDCPVVRSCAFAKNHAFNRTDAA